MKTIVALTLLVLLSLYSNAEAGSEPVCSFKNAQQETIFLKYLPLLKKGQDYVDFGVDGKCLKRATCSENFKTVVEECNKFPVTCSNKAQYSGVFPACCVKC